MKTKAQEWFLIKKNWIDWIEELTLEQRGELLTSLYTKQLPEGLLGTLVKSHMDEFDRVNDKREEGLSKRREASKKGNLIKSNSTPSGNPNVTLSTPTLARTKTKTSTITDTGTVTKTKDNLIKSFNKVNTIGNVKEFDIKFNDIK